MRRGNLVEGRSEMDGENICHKCQTKNSSRNSKELKSEGRLVINILRQFCRLT